MIESKWGLVLREGTMASPGVYLFWDNSNIFHSAQRYAEKKDGIGSRHSIRIYFEALYRLSLANRVMNKGIAVGSVPPDQEGLWKRFVDDTGIQLELYERGKLSGKEQGVDQCLQTHMLRALSDEAQPQVAVLLTGDGKGYDDGVGFHADLERMYKKGWGIEVISWDLACRSALKRWATTVGQYIQLEHYYKNITFLEGGRTVLPLSLTNRPRATIGGSPEYQQMQAKIQAEEIKDKEHTELEKEFKVLQEQLLKEQEKLKKAKAKTKYEKRIATGRKKKRRR